MVDLAGSDEQFDDLAQRFGLGFRLKIEYNLLWIDWT